MNIKINLTFKCGHSEICSVPKMSSAGIIRLRERIADRDLCGPCSIAYSIKYRAEHPETEQDKADTIVLRKLHNRFTANLSASPARNGREVIKGIL